MYIDVPRALVFFDQRDNAPCLLQYQPRSGVLQAPSGARADDTVCHVSAEGRLALRSLEPITVRGARRSRLGFTCGATLLHETTQYLSFWSRFAPSGRHALVSAFNGKKRPVVIDLDSGAHGAPIARDLDARFGDIDPLQGHLWAPDERTRNRLLKVDCASGEVTSVSLAMGDKIQNLRFARDGQHLFAVGCNSRLLCCDRDGATVWSVDLSEYGHLGAGQLFYNESASHLCLPVSSTPRSNWGEDLIIATANGHLENTVVRHKGPPSRLAADWFGNRLLTHGAEVVDFFTGEVLDQLRLTPAPA
ncbi:MAG: hypothetical protein LBE53_12065 [Paucimonas sp.]|jgi:hypothetical protein|nr:hypothetical protein [Paucimonas sp.]